MRYDQILLDMIDCVASEWGSVDTRTFAIVGFSGGGQFVHRFFYLYPERVHAVSIGAPGRATPLVDKAWPEGITGAPTSVAPSSRRGSSRSRRAQAKAQPVPTNESQLQPNGGTIEANDIPGGRAISVPELAKRTRSGKVAVQLLIGADDTWRPVQPDGSRAAHSRFDATQAVAKSFDDAGIVYDFTVVPGVKHEGDKIRGVAMPWMRRFVHPRE